MMAMLVRYLGQAAIYSGFAVLVWYFSAAPSYQPIPSSHAQIKLSFAHGGQPKGGCRDRTEAELAGLAPNMRKKKICPRERVPLFVAFDLNGTRVFEDTLPPTGLRGDGASQTYQKFIIPEGAHRMTFMLRDTERTEGFDYISERELSLVAGQNLAVDFDVVAGGFVFR